MKSSEKGIPSLGQLALRYGTINKTQFKTVAAFMQQKALKGEQYEFGALLIEKKLATRYQVNLLQIIRDFLVLKKKGEQFGQIAVDKGYATSEEVELALTRQQQLFREAKIQKMLGDLLVEYGVITEEQRDIITEEQKRLEKIDFDKPGPNNDNYEKSQSFTEQDDESAAKHEKPNEENEEDSQSSEEISFREAEREFIQLKALDDDFALRVLEKGFSTPEVVEAAMEKQNEWFEKFRKLHMLGDIMVSEGILTDMQKNLILKEQKRIHSSATDNSQNTHEISKSERLNGSDNLNESQELKEPNEVKEKIEITISDSQMEAWVNIPAALDKMEEIITPEEIISILNENAITYGICSDAIIKSHLDAKDSSFPVALGEYLYSSIPHYNFDIHKRDKNNLLKKNNVLASLDTKKVKIELLDITGKKVNTIPINPNHAVLRCGRGVTLSEDSTHVVAAMGGYPAMSVEGRFFIFPVVNILGDADIKYGPIDPYASVNIAGILTGAYRIQAGDVKAREIRGCRLDAVGDVTAEMGIMNCTIITQGNIKAKYIHNSRIESFGDVTVEHEIIDSTLLLSGKCIAEKSRVIASSVCARKGIKAAGIGSDVTEPCRLKVGAQDHIIRQSLYITKKISASRQSLDEAIEKKEKLGKKSEFIFNKMVDLKLLHDRAMAKSLRFNKEIEKGRISEDSASYEKTMCLIDALKEKMSSAISTLRKYNNQKKEIDARIDKMESTIKTLAERSRRKIFSLEMDRNRFFQWAESQPSVPEITVSGRIVEGTVINGAFASITLDDDYQNVKFTEKLKKIPVQKIV
ncbi:hypothetical protein MTBBW1_1310088 [Desulfamplus magnetovallimortis]|uniref:DUF342 domain-containing protein n=1 Tax=Desulfamplus magnetovallimortis TaxID=1246637 RepID=A0A1W1H7C9_9BACT|nr:FapA family protein [Desulfamplus magnetovallimortis]SLM28390.1 hypothetical protein MTBBW1_1310088 [Desulfamplus magnetovallimortis]